MSSTARPLNRVPQLDGIRGFAVAAVVFVHLSPMLEFSAGKSLLNIALYHIFHVGWLGVDIFFVLSGFLITGIILKSRHKPNFWTVFYARRGFRILPAFFAVLAATVFVAHFFAAEAKVSSSFILAAVFFMANWTIVTSTESPLLSHLWSLAIEEQFYFLWPHAAKRLSNSTLLKFALSLAVACELLRIVLVVLHINAYVIYKITPTRTDGLSIGAALAIGIALPSAHRFLADYWRRIAVSAATLLVIAFLVLRAGLFEFNPWSQVMAIPAVAVLTAMLIFGAMESTLPAGLAWFFSLPFMTYLGRRSYALYLIHVPVLVIVEASRRNGRLHRLPPGGAVNSLLMILAVAVCLALTEISWKLIESPAQILGHRWVRNKEGGNRANLSEEEAITQLANQNRLRQ